MKIIEGLDTFFYPKTVKKEKKEIIRSFDKSVMKEFYCKKHMIFFWRNVKNNTGHCGLCSKFISKINVPYLEIKNKEMIEMVKVKQSISIEDGKHEGKIIDIEERTEPYEYIDFIVEISVGDDKVKLKYGCPTAISVNKEKEPTTKLANVLVAFGMKLDLDKEITLEDMKLATQTKKCSVLIENKKTKEGTFANIVSLKPA